MSRQPTISVTKLVKDIAEEVCDQYIQRYIQTSDFQKEVGIAVERHSKRNANQQWSNFEKSSLGIAFNAFIENMANQHGRSIDATKSKLRSML